MVIWNRPDGYRPRGVEHRSFFSRSNRVEVGYNIRLPADYETRPDDRFPVVYFLHGAGGDENSDFAGFACLATELMDSGKIPPVILVSPNGGMSGYRDSSKAMGEALIIRELLPLIDGTVRTRASAEGRAVVGFSMGGGGAVKLAIEHPESFCAAGSFGGAFWPREHYPSDWGPDTLRERNLGLRICLAVGDEDVLFDTHPPLFEALDAAGLTSLKMVLPGVDHMLGDYLKASGDRMLDFLTEKF